MAALQNSDRTNNTPGAGEGPAGTNLDAVARLLVVVVHHTDPLARLGEWLRDAGLELEERHLSSGDELPVTLWRKPPTAAVAPPPICTFSTSWAAMPAIWATTGLLMEVLPRSRCGFA